MKPAYSLRSATPGSFFAAGGTEDGDKLALPETEADSFQCVNRVGVDVSTILISMPGAVASDAETGLHLHIHNGIIKKEVATWFMSVSVWRRWYLRRTY